MCAREGGLFAHRYALGEEPYITLYGFNRNFGVFLRPQLFSLFNNYLL
ncbi:mCG56106 [Mus musculus]|nr:mCG56106 [Mus musculus]